VSGSSILKSSPNDFEPRKKNAVSLGSDSNLDNDFKPFKIGDLNTGLEFSLTEIKSTKDVRTLKEITEELFVTIIKGNKQGSQTEPMFMFQNASPDSLNYGLHFNIFADGSSFINASGNDAQLFIDSDTTQLYTIGDDADNSFQWRFGDFGGTVTKLMSLEHEGELFLYSTADDSDYLKIDIGSAGVTTISTVDDGGATAHLKFEPDGSFLLKETASAGADVAGYGQLWIKNNTANELWFTNDAGNDIPISLQPFVKTAQFQDDIGTAQHYIPFNNISEQSSVGSENLGFIAPFNMKLQKVIIKCSEDISGATLEVGFWTINDGTTTHHHHGANQQNVDVTGGAAHTNAVADFTGTVNDGASSGGGSNAISAGQFIDMSIQADSDQTSSSAEWWITCYFLADLTTTV
tara:strand:- start:687 stop:1907 length:1221 start_codon:yes stop_codon:yes gene_type:complete